MSPVSKKVGGNGKGTFYLYHGVWIPALPLAWNCFENRLYLHENVLK